MSKKEQETIDTKAIEEKALNHLKRFIEDSKSISQFLTDNDKEPCWDGHLYLYSGGIRDKNHLLGRVPVQVKGTEVEEFKTKNWKFKIEKDDIKAYLHEPTFFIVCQIKKDSKEKKLFFREMMPEFVNKLLKDMEKQRSKMTLFYPLTEDLTEFEDQLKVFFRNSKKMVSFATAKTLSMADAMKRGIRNFTFIAPGRFTGMELLKYLSTHETYFYAKVDKDLDIEMPLSDGPARLAFKRDDDGDVKVDNRVFFKGYTSEIENGHFVVSIANIITIDIPMDATDEVGSTVKMTVKNQFLKDAINVAEFVVALNDVGVLTIGSVDLNLVLNEKDFVNDLRLRLACWKDLDAVLNKLHVTKPFDLTKIKKNQDRLIDLLIDTIGKGHTVILPKQQTTILTIEISNITLLLYCTVGKDNVCLLGDFFDKTVNIAYPVNEKETVNVSPFSYLQNEHFWEKIDNIDYDSIVESAQKAAKAHDFCFQMSNYDVLSMISASDAVEKFDVERSKKLLYEALKLDEWLINNDPYPDLNMVHVINKMQIVKRQRELSIEESQQLEKILEMDKLEVPIKVAVNLLLGNTKEVDELFATLPDEEKKAMRAFPIWKFYKQN
ncbi:MAG: hypothetical protein IJK22_03345 [Bacteroidales bacterium]|nr:hypothetical protein [Bacteroidales bacterium]